MQASWGKSIRVAVFFGAAFALLTMAAPWAWAGSGLRGGGGGGGPHHPWHHGPWHRGPYDWGMAAGAAAVGGMAGSSYYPQTQSYPASTPNCTDELQQEQGPYYNRIGQRRFCY